MNHYFISTPPHTEDLLSNELHSLGFSSIELTGRGVRAEGTLSEGYKACLWSRVANRVYLCLHKGNAESIEQIRNESASIPWEDHFDPETTISVTAHAKNSFLDNDDYTALLVKDGIADRFNQKIGKRPSVSRKSPGLRFYIYLDGTDITFYLDLSGESLHLRGYRSGQGEAPLKENIASALLYRMNWPDIVPAEGGFVDPLCGSGTLVIEAALIAFGIPPRLNRNRYGFHRWKKHQEEEWRMLCNEAEEISKQVSGKHSGNRKNIRFFGFDRDSKAVRAAMENSRRAGTGDIVQFFQSELASIGDALPPHMRKRALNGNTGNGLITTNAPYGERLGKPEELQFLYQLLGRTAKRYFNGWEAGVLTSDPSLGKAVGLRAHKIHTIQNGPLQCKLYHFSIHDENRFHPLIPIHAPRTRGHNSHLEEFANRLKKNKKKLIPWLKRNGISSYRLYDADLPEYAVAIDIYDSAYIHLQEYEPPAVIDRGKRYSRLAEIVEHLPELTGIRSENIYVKVRRRMKQNRQYRRYADTEEFLSIEEGGHAFLVNLNDFVDTGIFLDARFVRSKIQTISAGKSFCNLFCYTGTGSVYAAAGGAVSSLSIDSSNTYISWAKRNASLNTVDTSLHRFLKEDCFSWIEKTREKFDIIFIGPPTFSNSKDRTESFDLQRDHVPLLKSTVQLLKQGGTVLFLSNTKNFQLDEPSVRKFAGIKNVTAETFPIDFERKKRSFQCWELYT